MEGVMIGKVMIGRVSSFVGAGVVSVFGGEGELLSPGVVSGVECAAVEVFAVTGEGAGYLCLKKGVERREDVLKILERVVVEGFFVEDKSLGDAVFELNRLAMKGERGGVIPWVIRGKRVVGVEPRGAAGVFGEDAEVKFSLELRKASFLRAVDAMCLQAGHEWWIEVDEEGGAAVLVMAPR